MSDENERSAASAGSEAERPLGDPEIAVEILKLRVAELEQAIRRLAEQDATLSVCDGNVTVMMEGTLTDEEVSALLTCIADDEVMAHQSRATILRAMLERLG